MKTIKFLFVLTLASCGGGSIDGADTQPVDIALDAWVPVDVHSDMDEPEVMTPPDPAAFFEQLAHPGCLPDTGLVDRVHRFSTVDVLPDLDALSIDVMGDLVLVGTATGLYALPDGADAFTPVTLPGDPAPVRILGEADNGSAYVVQAGAISMVTPGLDVLPVIEVAGQAQAAFDCGDGFYLVEDGQLSVTTGAVNDPVDGAPATGVIAACCSGDAVWTCGGEGVCFRTEGAWESCWLPGDPFTAMTPLGDGGVIVATDGAVSSFSSGGAGDSLTAGPDGLPTAGIRALDARGDAWAVGHQVGASVVSGAAPFTSHFHSMRWLPAEEVRDVAFGDDGCLWAATPGGVSRIQPDEIALEDKAAVMKGHLDTFHWRLGFVSLYARGVDPWDPDPETAILWDDDNDGQWTEEALAAFCYAYQVTGEEEYYEAARKAVEGMFQLFDVPAQDFEAAGLGFGYPARSVVRDDEGQVFESKATQSNWHLVDHWDGHQYYWKDDTSSDEVTGHLYGLSVYHDLCAKDDEEREEVAHYLTGMIGYILDNGYKLLDLGGEPTTHGHWAPDDLAIALDGVEACCEEHGIDVCVDKCIGAYYGGGFLNAVEILGGLLAAWHVSGEERFLEAYETLVTGHRYDEVVTFSENVATWTDSHLANYCDHELADLAFLTLLRYEPYPERRAFWEQQVLASFEYETGERNPLKTLVIASTQEDVPGLEKGVRTLLDYPSDMRDWLVDNSHRVDVAMNGKDRHGNKQFATGLPYDEIHVMRWDSNPYRVSKGGDGAYRLTSTFWLLPYWGLRYYGGICPAGN